LPPTGEYSCFVHCNVLTRFTARIDLMHSPVKHKEKEVAMFRKHFARAAALLAAAATTILVFSAVAGLADEDRAELLAAQNPPAIVAGHGAPIAR